MRISKNNLDEMIPLAEVAIRTTGIADPLNTVAKNFNGYISSYGADMTLSSPLAATIFFEDSSKSEEERHKVPEAILTLLKNKGWAGAERKLSDWLKVHPRDLTRHRQIVLCATALKFALRTFKKRK